MRSLGWAAIALFSAISFNFAAELPKSDEPDSFDIEPPLLIPNRDAEKSGKDSAEPAPPAVVDLAKLEKDLGRAERNAAGTIHLFKIGAIAEVEVERKRLRVAEMRAQVETARLAQAKEEFAEAQTRLTKGEISREQFSEAEAAVARAIELAHTADANRRKAEIEFAENDLARQRKLLDLGSGRKTDVARSQQKLNDLKAAQEQN